MRLCTLWFSLFIEASDSGAEFLEPVVKLLHLDSYDINKYSSMDVAGEVRLWVYISTALLSLVKPCDALELNFFILWPNLRYII